ncbi:MAG TPA: hypothetical protein PK544_06810 [Spirochaetota bacterium]|nr:hypothetical protein [Spirochaetota bacterium]HPJ39821.1 hypothetical protein [Spirochaetota bacterium]HPQ53223.1 hypothetical protein [Spirochaetota bacterium]
MIDTCAKCGDEKDIHATCKNCGAKVCASCFDGWTNCPKCDNGDMELT